jgi:hypothetical protein
MSTGRIDDRKTAAGSLSREWTATTFGDGNVMIEKPTERLCPYCANSIAEDVANCAYCKADLSSDFAPQWLSRNEPAAEPRAQRRRTGRFSIPAKFLWPGALLTAILSGFLAGGYASRNRLTPAAGAELKELRLKEQMILSQEAQLAELRQQLKERADQIAALNNKLEGAQKDLSSQERTGGARREVARPSDANRATAVRSTTARAPAAPVAAPSARPNRPSVYETTRETAVYEKPTASSRVLSQIGSGTRINVVTTVGDWLEVRSKHGNPPGYVRASDTRRFTGAT